MTVTARQMSRRTLLAGAGLLAAGASGCSRTSTPTRDPGPTATSLFEFGDVRASVPADPQRVVSVEGRGDLEFALLAEWPLVGVWNGAAPLQRPGGQYSGMLSDSVSLLTGGVDRPEIEEIAALEPDLIVVRANSWRLDSYGNELLAGVAPLLPVEVNRPTFRQDMTTQLDAVGRGDTAEQWLGRYDDVISTGRVAISSSGAPTAVALLSTQMAAGGSVRWWTNKLATTVATDLGLDVLGLDITDDAGEIELSLEQIGQVAAAGTIFHQTPSENPVATVPTWQALPAVRAGRAHALDPMLNNGLAVTATALAQRMTEALTGS